MSEYFYNTLSSKKEKKEDWINFMTEYTGLPRKEIEQYFEGYVNVGLFKEIEE